MHPSSIVPMNDSIAFPKTYVGGGATPDDEKGMGFADATDVTGDDNAWKLTFPLPRGQLPAGLTPYLVLDTRAPVATGVLALNVSAMCVDPGLSAEEDPSDGTYTDEGSVDVDYGTGSYVADEYRQVLLEITETLVAGERLHVLIAYDDSAHTIAAEAWADAYLIWE